jgi:hypothetical protein
MPSRNRNEKKFLHWEDLPDGGRRYWRDREGAEWGFQRIILIVDAVETTLSLVQEIYDDEGQLVERHQKYPVDTGHQVLRPQEQDVEGNDED